ncbi:MAG: response regulator, partial [Bryobacteraceae bacterium]
PEGDSSLVPMPDLILMDLNMPKVSGLELLRKLRSSTRFKQVPIAICTSSNSPEDREEAMSLGIDGYIAKPIELKSFLEGVGAAVRDILAANCPAPLQVKSNKSGR